MVAELRRAIFDGELESGTPLREVAIAEALGVSRPTVREALTVLVADGLAAREPNRGVAVATPEGESVRDLCAARLVLEGAGIRSWRSAHETQRAVVRQALEDYLTAIDSGASYQELNRRHLDFHNCLVRLTGSPRLVAMEESLAVELKLALAQVERLRRNAHDQGASHRALIQLLEEDRIEDAHAFLTDHLTAAPGEIIEALGLA